jgi:cytoskeletal protein CcmA (bactofilin family)
MKIRSVIAGLFALLLLLVLPATALAADFRGADGRQDVSGAVDDDVYIAGDEIVISGEVTGDVFGAGRSIRLTGSTGQSFFAGAQDVTIDGTVGHSARVGAQDLVVSGTVTQDLLSAGQTVTVETEGQIGRDIWAGGQNLTVAGNVARDIRGGVQDLTISGTVGGNVEVDADNVTLEDGARIAGDLIYTSNNEADIDAGAEVTGEVVRREPKAAPADDRNPVVDTILDFLRGVAGAFALGLVLLWLIPDLLPLLARTMRNAIAPSLGIGLAALFLVPVVALIAFILALVLGAFGAIPLLLLTVYGFLLILAKAAVGYLIGSMILKQVDDPAARRPLVDSLKALAIGVTILTVIMLVPFIGGLVGFITGVLTLGAGIVAFMNWRKARTPAAAPPPGVPPAPAGPVGA